MDMKQNVETIHEAITTQSKKANLVAGAKIAWFRFPKPSNLSEACRGSLVIIGEREEDARFFLYSIASLDQVKAIAKVSSKLRTPFLLCVKLVSLTYTQRGTEEELALCYDPFDDTFSHWIEKKPQRPFAANEGLLNEWWQIQIRNILGTLAFMHGKRVFHGNMGRESSYVIIKGAIHLINASIVGFGKNEADLNLLGQKDLEGLKNFLGKNVQPAYRSTDWTDFIDLFDIATVHQLIKHPVLMDATARFKYFRSISSYISYEMAPVVRSNLKTLLNSSVPSSKKFEDWDSKIPPDSVLYDVYAHNCPYYESHKADNLLEYVLKVFDHYNERAKQKLKLSPDSIDQAECCVCSKDQVESRISSLYPGFLSYIHGIFVKHFPNCGISVE